MFCRIYQWSIEKEVDDCGYIHRGNLLRHVQRCSKCRTFYHRLTQLGQQLRAATPSELSEEQIEKIYSAIGRRLANQPPVQTASSNCRLHRRFHLRYAVSAAAVLLFSLAGLYYYIGNHKQADPLTRFVRNSTEFQGRISSFARLPEQSIQLEIQKLANDTQDALRFVSRCIPSAPANISEPQMWTETSSQSR